MGTTPLTADSSIATWLEDPAGNAILTDMLAQGGQTPDVFKPIKRLAIKRLVKMSRGAFTQEMLDDLVAAPPRATFPPAPNAEPPRRDATRRRAASASVPLREWTERIDEGRFTGQTVIVTGAGSGHRPCHGLPHRPRRRPRDRGRCQPGAPRRVRRRARRRRHRRRSSPTSPTTRASRASSTAAGGHDRRARQHRRDHGRHDPGRRRDRCRVGPRLPRQRHRHHEAHARGHPRDARPGRRVDREHRIRGRTARLGGRCRVHGVQARGRRPHQEQRLHVRAQRASA